MIYLDIGDRRCGGEKKMSVPHTSGQDVMERIDEERVYTVPSRQKMIRCKILKSVNYLKGNVIESCLIKDANQSRSINHY